MNGFEGYDAGYRDGWHDIHLSTRWRRSRRRRNSTTYTTEAKGEYVLGYKQGRVDGAAHPACPEWDDVHRVGGVLPESCPWNPTTASRTPTWSPLSAHSMDTGNVGVGEVRVRAAALGITLLKSPSTAQDE